MTYDGTQVPDGKLRLWLYQTESVAPFVDEAVIASTFRIRDETTVPTRDDSTSDYFYGMFPLTCQ
jgi:hypothetical protein